MFRFSSPVTLQLASGDLIAWTRQSGVKLVVIAGTAWVTQTNDYADHVLRPGQSMHLRRGALVSAECDAAFRFEAPPTWYGTLARAMRRLVRRSLPRSGRAAATVAG